MGPSRTLNIWVKSTIICMYHIRPLWFQYVPLHATIYSTVRIYYIYIIIITLRCIYHDQFCPFMAMERHKQYITVYTCQLSSHAPCIMYILLLLVTNYYSHLLYSGFSSVAMATRYTVYGYATLPQMQANFWLIWLFSAVSPGRNPYCSLADRAKGRKV